MRNKGFTLIEILIVFVILVVCIGGVGWTMNIWKLCHCDFQPSYKAEICRALGIVVVPMGMIEGFITIKDGEGVVVPDPNLIAE